MQIGDSLSKVPGRWSAGWRPALACALAAGLSWLLAHHLFGHQHPVFAAVAAIICLSPGLPNHVHQGIGMILGVMIGLLVGEIALAFKQVDLPVMVCAVTFVAIMLAIVFGTAPVIPIQAGVSAILILVLGPATAGTARLIDVGVGTAVGLVISEALLKPRSLRAIEHAARTMLGVLAKGLR